MESLTANTCDENWTPKFVYRDPQGHNGQYMAYKMVEMTNMAAYLNTDAEMYGHLSTGLATNSFFYLCFCCKKSLI